MAGAAVAPGAAVEGINSSTPPVLFGPELERMDYEFLDALRRGDERFVRRVLFSNVSEVSVAIGLPDHADNVTELPAERTSWRGVALGGNSALHVVAGYGHLRLAKLICDRESSLLETRNVALETPLHRAARAGADRMVSHFISVAKEWEGGRWLGSVLRAKDRPEGKTALHAAAQEGHAAVAKVLMSEDPGLATVVDDKGISPLYAAVLSRSLEVVQILIGSPAKGGEQVRISSGATPEASYAGPNKQTALHAAVMVESSEIADKLLQWKPTLAKKVDNLGSTPLHYLATTSNSYMVRRLLNCDTSSTYLSDFEGLCPIHVAARMGRYAIIRELINHRHNMGELVDNQGRNFLHMAVLADTLKVVKYVCRHPMLANMMNARDYQGNTPLHLAVYTKNQNIVSFLLRNRSVHPSIMNEDGQTPLGLAIIRHDFGSTSLLDPLFWIFECLREIGATCGPQRLDRIMEENITTPDLEKELKKYESITQNLVIASVLIATVTFAAAFTMPGGDIADDHQNGGSPTLARKYVFKAFIISDCVAFLCSTIATCWLMYAGLHGIDPSLRIKLILGCGPFLRLATQSMVAAFALSVHVVLAPVSIVIGPIVCIFAFPSLLLTDPQIWQYFHLAMTLKSRLGWSGMCKTRLIRQPPGFETENFCSVFFRQIVWHLLACIVIFLVPLVDEAIHFISISFNKKH